MSTNYLNLSQVLLIHARQIEEFGGASGVRDAGLIEAALLRPQSGYYSDIIEEASALWESLTMNHGFVDENKRIGFACMHTFLGINGIQLTADPKELLGFILSSLEQGNFEKNNLDAWLRSNTKQL